LEVPVVHERLYRSRTDRVLFGVAGGFAEWLDIDPSLVRLVWALLVVAGGAGLLLYIIAALVIPEEPWEASTAVPTTPDAAGGATGVDPATASAGTDAQVVNAAAAPGMTRGQARQARRAARQAARGRGDGTGLLVLGVILVAVGGLFLVRDLLPAFDDRFFGPALLIAIGVVLVAGAIRRQGGDHPG
jgi:phage shock protein PspC (stress-responsive transcriptional regulator)